MARQRCEVEHLILADFPSGNLLDLRQRFGEAPLWRDRGTPRRLLKPVLLLLPGGYGRLAGRVDAVCEGGEPWRVVTATLGGCGATAAVAVLGGDVVVVGAVEHEAREGIGACEAARKVIHHNSMSDEGYRRGGEEGEKPRGNELRCKPHVCRPRWKSRCDNLAFSCRYRKTNNLPKTERTTCGTAPIPRRVNPKMSPVIGGEECPAYIPPRGCINLLKTACSTALVRRHPSRVLGPGPGLGPWAAFVAGFYGLSVPVGF